MAEGLLEPRADSSFRRAVPGRYIKDIPGRPTGRDLLHRRTALFAVSLMWVLGAVVGPVTAAPGSSSDRPFSEHRTAEVLVKYRRGAQPAEVRSIVAGTVTKRFRGMSLEVLDPAGSVADAVAALNADPRVEYA
ncbi:MAG: S8 family serine peptidase, partial [Actinomycetota bacterium]